MMPKGVEHRKGPKPVTPPEGYLSAAQAAERLGCTPWTVIKLLRDGRLQGYRAPKVGQYERWWVEEPSVALLKRQKTWRTPRGRHKRTPAPEAPQPAPDLEARRWDGIYGYSPTPNTPQPAPAPVATNGPRPQAQAKARPRATPAATDRLWTLLMRLHTQAGEALTELRAGIDEAIGDEVYVLARRTLIAELVLLGRLCGEPEHVDPPDTVDWLGEGEDA